MHINQSSEELSSSRPSMFSIIFLNDDSTPLEFVENLLIAEFNIAPEIVDFITWRIHTSGWASFGSYSRDVADAKVKKVRDISREKGYPLCCNIQPINL